MTQTIQLNINNQTIGPLDVPDGLMMVDFLHEYLNLTGTKFGCGAGVCHACTIIIDHDDGTSEVVRSCINGVERFNNKKIRTVEGHAKKNEQNEISELHPIQMAFLTHYSFQCGWCTAGFVNEAIALYERLKRNPIQKSKVEETIDAALGDHICRCTGYVKYFAAVKDVILNTEGLTR